jgi:type I restriction enzyme S subunit
MSDSLPKGWATCEIRACFRSFSGGTPDRSKPAYWNGTVPWLSSGDIKHDIVRTSSESITKAGLENSSAQLCRPGSVVVVVRSGILKHTLPVAVLQNEAAINQDLKCFDSGNDKLNAWFALALRSAAKDILALNREGTTVQSVKYDTLKEFELRIPPPGEQSRIVERLGSLLAKVDVVRARMETVPTVLKRFRRAVLAAACDGRLTADWREQNRDVSRAENFSDGMPPEGVDLPASWSWMLSSRAFEFVTSGSRGWARYYSKSGALFIRIGNLDHDSIELDLSEVQRVSPPSGAEGRRTRVVQGDILISITADVGMIALVKERLEEAYINQHVALARPNGNMDRRYLAYFLAAQTGGQQQFLNLQRGATKVGLGLDDIRNIWIARPPAPEQLEIVRRVESLLTLADRLQGRSEVARTQVKRLTESILAKAFRGELVLTEAELARREGREYETAEQLLARVRAKSATTHNGAGRRGRTTRATR